MSRMRSVIAAGFRWWQASNKDFIDAAAIHIHNLKTQAVPLEAIRCLRDAPDAHHDKAGQSVVISTFVLREDGLIDVILELINIDHSINVPRIVRARGDAGLLGSGGQ